MEVAKISPIDVNPVHGTAELGICDDGTGGRL